MVGSICSISLVSFAFASANVGKSILEKIIQEKLQKKVFSYSYVHDVLF